MARRLVRVYLLATIVCYAHSEKTGRNLTDQPARKDPVGDKLFVNIVRGRNSSNDTEAHDRNLEKQSRATVHRVESDPRDKYGWQSQSADSIGVTRRPTIGNHPGGSYEGSLTGDRFAFRPSYASESTRRPGGYETGFSGGYSYGNDGYSGGRPSSSSGTSSGYGISGSLANGDEFGPAEPSFPEGGAPPVPNIQTQKAVALKALAGVALIGAAAALATNPVLLPIGIISAGRKKRSNLSTEEEDARLEHISRIPDSFEDFKQYSRMRSYKRPL